MDKETLEKMKNEQCDEIVRYLKFCYILFQDISDELWSDTQEAITQCAIRFHNKGIEAEIHAIQCEMNRVKEKLNFQETKTQSMDDLKEKAKELVLEIYHDMPPHIGDMLDEEDRWEEEYLVREYVPKIMEFTTKLHTNESKKQTHP